MLYSSTVSDCVSDKAHHGLTAAEEEDPAVSLKVQLFPAVT